MKKRPPCSLTVHVTRAHIDAGCHEDCRLCPVALAVREALPGAEVYADYYCLRVNDLCYRVPEAVRDFMMDFDSRERSRRWLRPFAFELELQSPATGGQSR
jgi:hypothetical protein